LPLLFVREGNVWTACFSYALLRRLTVLQTTSQLGYYVLGSSGWEGTVFSVLALIVIATLVFQAVMQWFPQGSRGNDSVLQDIFLNNQPDALIIPILFCYKTLHVSGILFAYHQEFSTVHLTLVSFMQVSDDRFQAESGWNCSSILTLLGSGHQKPAWNFPVPNDDRFQAVRMELQFHPDFAWKRSSETCMKLTSAEWWPLPSSQDEIAVPSWLCLEAVIRNLHETYQCRMMTASKQSGWNCSSILTLLGSGHQKPAWDFPVPNDDRFQAVRMNLQFHPDFAWKRSSDTCMRLSSAEWWPLPSSQDEIAVPSWLCLEAVIKHLHETFQCRMMTASKQSGWNCSSSWLCLEAVIRKLYGTYHCRMMTASKQSGWNCSSILTLLGSGH